MQSLKRKTLLWGEAERAAVRDRQRAAAARTGQVVRSTVDVYGEPALLEQVFEEAADTAGITVEQEQSLSILDEDQAGSLDQFLDGDGSSIEDILDAGELGMETAEAEASQWDETADIGGATHEAVMDVIGANIAVDQAQEAAEKAADDALHAQQTADGRNRIFAQAMNPVAPPEIPFVNGDLWYRTELVGGEVRFTDVFMWDGGAWKKYQLVAGSFLVPGSVGPVLIENGAITGQKLAATAVDGKTITGALIRTAPSGQRLQLDEYGLSAYNPLNQVTATIQSQGGYMTVNGGGLRVTQDAVGAQGKTIANYFGSGFRIQPEEVGTGRYQTLSPSMGLEQVKPSSTAAGATWENSRLSSGDLLIRAQYTQDPTSYFGRFDVAPANGTMTLGYRSSPGATEQKLAWYPHGSGGFALSTNELGVPLLIAKSTHTEFRSPVRFNGDVDWTSVSIPGGSGICQWSRSAGIIYLQFDITYATALGVGAALAPGFTLPAAVRPPGNWPITVMGAGSWPAVGYIEASTGNSAIRNVSDAARTRFIGSGQWPATN